MNLTCAVVEDLLPMYYDCVCSDESAALIEDHLKKCPQCSRALAALHTELEVPKTNVNDLKPLEGIQKKWQASKWSNIRKGICFSLAFLLLITAILSAAWYFSYGRYYYQLTDNMSRTSQEDSFFTSSDYTAVKDGYRFEVWLPILLSDSGFARVMDETGLVLFIYPQKGGSYTYRLYITDQNNESYFVYLKNDLTPDFENHPFPVRAEAQKEHIAQLLSEKRTQLISMLDAIHDQWSIEPFSIP